MNKTLHWFDENVIICISMEIAYISFHRDILIGRYIAHWALLFLWEYISNEKRT